jgi:hypothetical protein
MNFIDQTLKEFDEKFVQDSDPKDNGASYLFRINKDGSRSIALPSDVKQFLSSKIREAVKRFDEITFSEIVIDEKDELLYRERTLKHREKALSEIWN